jgi:hypothetical protein
MTPPSSAGECWACEATLEAVRRDGPLPRRLSRLLERAEVPDCGDSLGYDIGTRRQFTRCGDCLAKCFRPLNIA